MNTANAFLDNRRWLWAVVYARLGDRTATEDVLQEISLAAIRQEKCATDIQQVKGWLYQVAVKQVLLFRRQEARYRSKIQRYAATAPTAESSIGIEHLCAGEQLKQVRDALHMIRPSDRQVLVMKYSEALSCRAIAEHLGVTETTIQSRLLRARRRLRELLTKHADFED